jgi:NitT/TauT family transport system substrate-binding protein
MKYKALRIQKLLIFLLSILVIAGCGSTKNEKEIKIATNKWIGYAPLFWANENGALKKLHFHLIQSVSLAEAMEIFSIGRADMVTTTQHEYFTLKQTTSIKPVILLDRSNGGDMILSNTSLSQLQKAPRIDVYLEVDSINSELFKSFARAYHIDMNRTVFHNQDQQMIQNVENNPHKPTIIVTYSPYDIPLIEKGFHSVASTKDSDIIIVIDALCTGEDIIKKYPHRLKALKKAIDDAVLLIEQDPKTAHTKIKKYLGNITYEEFRDSLSMIKWINHPSDKIIQIIKKMGYEEDTILQ